MNKLTRRQFVKRTTGIGIGAALTFSGLDIFKSAHATQINSNVARTKDAYDFTLMMVDYSDPVRQALDEVIIPMFVQENPGSNVTVNYSDWSRYNEEIITAFAGGVTPDVFQGGAVWAPQMAGRGWAYPLNDFIDADTAWDWNDFPEALRDDVTIDGKIVGVPYRQDLRTLWYRRDLLEEAGFTAPPKTWNEFLEVAEATTEKSGNVFMVEGYHLSDSTEGWQGDWQAFLPWLYQAGGSVLSDDLSTCLLDTEEAIRALEFVQSLIQEHEVTSYPGLEPQGDLNVIVAGQAALTNSNSDIEQTVQLYAPDQADIVVPALPLTGTTQATHTFLNKFFISSQSNSPERSWDLLSFLTRKDILEIYSEANNNTPTRTSLFSAPYLSEQHKLVLEATKYARTYPKHPKLLELFAPIAEELEQCLAGRKSARDALTAATQAVNTLL